MSLTVFPLLRLVCGRDAMATKRASQRAVHYSWRFFIWFMKSAGILTWEVQGAERLRQPGRLIIANHPSLLDVVFMISLMPMIDCIVKPGILRNPFMRGPASWAGYIPNGDPERLIEDCSRTLREGNSLLMFPEGTRTRPGQPINMKRGAAQIALAAEVEILPVTITVVPTTLTKNEPWYQIPARPFHVTLSAGEPLSLSRFMQGGASRATAARHITEYLEEYFGRSTAAQTAEVQARIVGTVPMPV
ncbi:MAG: 1-acyl-sn-glycerol-3-phosphate acyltransferase [Rhizobium sp.]|nr:MAG: 1-acyl-sn-glycerol-3-phosphate acyltransferase [Rhizobium sp.]